MSNSIVRAVWAGFFTAVFGFLLIVFAAIFGSIIPLYWVGGAFLLLGGISFIIFVIIHKSSG